MRPTPRTLLAFACLALTTWALGRAVLVDASPTPETPRGASTASTAAGVAPGPASARDRASTALPSAPLAAAPTTRGAPTTRVEPTHAQPTHAEPSGPTVEDLLGALDEDPDLTLDARALAILEAALADGTLELPLRAGALRAALERGGRGALARAVARFGDDDLAPLRDHLAHAVTRGAGPTDEALVVTLLDGADAAQDDGAAHARALATFAAAEAARRDDDPVALSSTTLTRVTRALDALARDGSPDAAEALARLGTPGALDALETLSRDARDEEARLDAALALTLANAPRGAAALAALAPTLTDPLLRARLETSCAR